MWIEGLVCVLSILGAVNLVALFIVSRREKKAWNERMEEIEKKYTAALCASGAQFARSRMRSRALKNLLGVVFFYGVNAEESAKAIRRYKAQYPE